MTIEQKGVVDIVSVPPDADTASLIISDHLPWDIDANKHMLLIQEKINEYLSFIESGSLFESRPDLKNKRLILTVVGLYEPSTAGREFLTRLQEVLARNGYPFVFEIRQD